MTYSVQPFLFSYVYTSKSERRLYRRLLEAEAELLLIDSGAFTAHTQGITISREDYLSWLDGFHGPTLWGAITLDVVGNARLTEENTAWLAARREGIMPVLVTGYRTEKAKELYEINPRFCVAGASNKSPRGLSWVQARLQKIRTLLPEDAAPHVLGFARYPLALSFACKSWDSSSNEGGGKYGWVRAFDPIQRRRLQWRPSDPAHPYPPPWVLDLFVKHRITQADLKGTMWSFSRYTSAIAERKLTEDAAQHGRISFSVGGRLESMATMALSVLARDYRDFRQRGETWSRLRGESRSDGCFDLWMQAAERLKEERGEALDPVR